MGAITTGETVRPFFLGYTIFRPGVSYDCRQTEAMLVTEMRDWILRSGQRGIPKYGWYFADKAIRGPRGPGLGPRGPGGSRGRATQA